MKFLVKKNTSENCREDLYEVIEECETLEEAIEEVHWCRREDEVAGIDPYNNNEDSHYFDYYIEEVFDNGRIWKKHYTNSDDQLI